jgi:glutathione S-transferase
MIKAYGNSASGNCWKVSTVLTLTGRPFQWIEIDSNAGQTRTHEYLALNPNGKVPIVQLEGGAVITESNAILAHFGEGTRLLPAPGLDRTRVFEWLFFEQYSHEPYIATLRNWIAWKREKTKHAAELPGMWESGHKALAVMEQRLAKAPYLAVNQLSIADIALYAYTHRAEEGEFDLARYPGIQAWLARVAAEPGLTPIAPAKKAVS